MAGEELGWGLKSKSDLLRLEARKEAQSSVFKANRRAHAQNEDSVLPSLAAVEEYHEYVRGFLGGDPQVSLLMLYYGLSNIRMHLNAQEPSALPRLLDELFASGRAQRILSALALLAAESEAEQTVDARLLCVSELLWVCVSLFCAREAHLHAHLSPALLSALLGLLATRNIVIVDRVFFALANAAEENFALCAAMSAADVLVRADEAIDALHQSNPRGQPFVLGNYFALVRALTGIGVAPPRPLNDYLVACLRCYAKRHEYLAVLEPVVLRFIADLAAKVPGAALEKVWAMAEFDEALGRMAAAVRGIESNRKSGLSALAALSAGVGPDALIPAELLRAVLEEGLCGGDQPGQMLAMIFFGNVLTRCELLLENLTRELALRLARILPAAEGDHLEACLRLMALLSPLESTAVERRELTEALEAHIRAKGAGDSKRLALMALNAWRHPQASIPNVE